MLHCPFPLLMKSASGEDRHYFLLLVFVLVDLVLYFFCVYHNHHHIQMEHLSAIKSVLDGLCECFITYIWKCGNTFSDIILPGKITSFSWTRLATFSWKSGNMCIKASETPNIPKRLLFPNEVIAWPIFSLLSFLKSTSMQNSD